MVIERSNRCFNSVRKRNHYFPQKYCPRCCLFHWRNSENTWIVTEHLCYVSQYFWEYSAFVIIFVDNRKLWAINKYIFLCWMPMKIKKHEQIFFKCQFCIHNYFLKEIYFWENLFWRVFILSIKIFPWNSSSIMSKNNSIRVEHRYNFKNKALSE